MRLSISTTGIDFFCTREPVEQFDLSTGARRLDRRSGLPLWNLELVAVDEAGGEVVSIVVPGQRPQLTVGAKVLVDELIATPWVSGSDAKVAFRARSVAVDESEEIANANNFSQTNQP
jgi:hypothetical protein